MRINEANDIEAWDEIKEKPSWISAVRASNQFRRSSLKYDIENATTSRTKCKTTSRTTSETTSRACVHSVKKSAIKEYIQWNLALSHPLIIQQSIIEMISIYSKASKASLEMRSLTVQAPCNVSMTGSQTAVVGRRKTIAVGQ